MRGKLKKELGLFDVYAVSTGAMFSSGFFLLPGLAAAKAGPAVGLAYLLAGVLIMPAMLSVAELTTAMPKSGGAYYFITRALGPAAGTVGGLGTYIALTLKTAFALVGIGAYASLFIDFDVETVAVVLTVFFAVLNIVGAKETTRLQRFLVSILVGVLLLFLFEGARSVVHLDYGQVIDSRFTPFAPTGLAGILGTVGFVFVSYAGLTKVASVAEEVRNPSRTIPLGMALSLISTSLIYVVGVFIMTAIIPVDEFVSDLTPVATAAGRMFEWLPGQTGLILIVVSAVAAFASTGNAGLMASSRYPFAMGRDRLVPRRLAQLGRYQTPTLAIVMTTALMVFFILLLDEEGIAKLASAFQLLIFVLLHVCVIVMRESRIKSYDPGYRSPLYPWMQIFGMVTSAALIFYMGWEAIVFSAVMVGLCAGWYIVYAKGEVHEDSALLHVFKRWGADAGKRVERELRPTMQRTGEATEFVQKALDRAQVLDFDNAELSYHDVASDVSVLFAQRLNVTKDEMTKGFDQARELGAVPVWHG
ncbi:MAG: APC family permease, partial [Bacteroidota bacterium]